MAHTHRDRGEHRDRGARGDRGSGQSTRTGRRRCRRERGALFAGRRPGIRRALRREVPSTVPVLADETDFAAMRRYHSFLRFPDHRTYLRQTEALLRSLTARGVHVRVVRFDPRAFAAFCVRHRLDPDSPASRSRYTAETASLGSALPYGGQPLTSVLAQLREAARRRLSWDRATETLSAAGPCPCCDQDLAALAVRRAARAVTAILDVSGPGTQHLVCSVSQGGAPLFAALLVESGGEDDLRLAEADALLFCTVLAAGLVAGTPGGVVLRTTPVGGEAPEVLRGWRLEGDWLTALTEAEVFSAYCTDSLTGEPIPPEPDVLYQPGCDLPRPGDGH